jgi:Xaa-Pro aminopeptidase
VTSMAERVRSPVSRGELERRWQAVRAQMPDAGVEAIVVQGASNLVGIGGYFRWFTGSSAWGNHQPTVIFPKDELMTLVCHGAYDGDAKLDGNDPVLAGIGRRLTTPAFPNINYASEYEAEIVARELVKGGYRKVGIFPHDGAYYTALKGIEKRAPQISLIDVSGLVDPIKAVKSAEEVAAIRACAAMQDEAFEKTRAFIRPGMRDYEVSAYSHYMSTLLGSETGYILAGSGAPGEPALYRTPTQQGRQMNAGDAYFWQAENTGPGGYFTHVGRIFVLGKAPQELVDAFGQMVEAQDFTMKLLRPGASCAEAFAEYQAYMRRRGLPEENRLHCHGQGYNNVERPLIRGDETMPIRETMNIGCHPGYVTPRMFITVCDNFLIGKDGAERLHKIPQKIYEL